LVFIDESGFLMSPLVRRTLALKGQTPQLLPKVRHQGRGRDKVSMIAALTQSPMLQHLGLYFSSLVNDSFDHSAVAWFLRELRKHLRGPVIVVWDRGPMHQGPDIGNCSKIFHVYILSNFPRTPLTSTRWSAYGVTSKGAA
jgi:DDE superfamily endonuclease